MSSELDRKPALGRGTALASVVALLSCAVASDMGPSSGNLKSSGQDLSARVTTLAEQIRLAEPSLRQDSPPEIQLAQWRNY